MNRIQRIMEAYDTFLNNVYLPHPRLGQTISYNSAVSRDKGEQWACIICKLLDIIVQPGHCTQTRAREATPLIALIRAGAALLFVAFMHFLAMYGIVLLIGHFLWHFL